MKAVVIQKPNAPIVIEDRPIPQPKGGEVLIKVYACGVCHSDLNVLLGYFPFATYPRVPGHEVAGVVEKVGESVSWPKVGDRVGMQGCSQPAAIAISACVAPMFCVPLPRSPALPRTAVISST